LVLVKSITELENATTSKLNAIDVNNEMAVNSLDAITENFETFNGSIDSLTEFKINAAKTWN
jgi:hypothetical protein